MKDLYLAFGLLVVGFATLAMRLTRKPFDYSQQLLVDSTREDSLSNAMDKALKAQKSPIKIIVQPNNVK